MKINTLIKLSLFLMVLLCIGGCKACREECDDPTNPECPNYKPVPPNPCAGQQPVSADFTIEERVQYLPTVYNTTECVLTGNLILLKAKQNNLQYKWIIGSDTIETQEYDFYFPSSFACQSIPLKLIVSGSPNSGCFPNDNGMDTVVKYVDVTNFSSNRIWGTYRVSAELAPNDSFNIRFWWVDDPGSGLLFFTKNLNNTDQQDSCWAESTGVGCDYFQFYSDILPCSKPRGFCKLINEEEIVGEYQILMEGSTNQYQTFKIKGRRIN